MPEWLKTLLAAQGSLGLVDSLQTLVGVQPAFAQIASENRHVGGQAAQLGGRLFADDAGNPVIGLTPYTVNNFDRLGDKIVSHEFGHLAASGYGDINLTRSLESLYSNAGESEELADDFQRAIQFLRSGEASVSSLPKRTRKLVDVLLQQELYSEHPINKGRAFKQLVSPQ